jgi:indolepyruvate ferredoxin oxidoreductase
LNRVAVKQNLQSFRYGRLFIADPARVRALVDPPARTAQDETERMAAQLTGSRAQAYASLLAACKHLDAESQRLLAIRIGELIEFQDSNYTKLFVDFVLSVAARERAAMSEQYEVTHAVIRHLYKLMAYKDEYEVARLHLKPSFLSGTQNLFVEPRRMVYNLHPPLLRQFGLKRKLQFGPWFKPALRMLRAMKGLRGTAFDAFGYAHVRKEERNLILWYKELVSSALDHLNSEQYSLIAEIACLPDRIRGYEEIKMRNVKIVKDRAAKLVETLSGSTVAMEQPFRLVQ